MQQLIRSWPGLASSGAALLYAAAGAGVVVSTTQPLSLAIGIILIALAGLHGLWSVAAFRSGSLARPGLSLALFLSPPVVWALALFTPGGSHAGHGGGTSLAGHPASIAVGPMASAVLLSLGLAVACGVRMRRPAPRRAPAASGASFMVGLVLGGLVISALVTPALAASAAGELAVPHGTHSAH